MATIVAVITSAANDDGDLPERAGGDALADQVADATRRGLGVARVDLGGGREGGHVVEEPCRGGRELGGHGTQVGRDAVGGRGDRGHRGLDPRGGALEEVHDRGAHELLLRPGERVERALGAAQAAGELVEREVGEALGEQQVDQRVEELRVARGTPSGRARSGHGPTLALLLSVL